MYSMTGDGHPRTIPAMNTGNDAMRTQENKLTAHTQGARGGGADCPGCDGVLYSWIGGLLI